MIRVRNKKKIALVLSGGGIKAAAYHLGVCLALKERGFRLAGGSREYSRLAYPYDYSPTIRTYVGSSAGAFIASILASGYSLEALIQAFRVGIQRESTSQNDYSNSDKLPPIRYLDIFRLNAKSIAKSLPQAFLDSIFEKSLTSGGFETLLKNKFRMNGLFTTQNLESYLREKVLLLNQFNQLGAELYIVATFLNENGKAIFGPFEKSTHDQISWASISEAVSASTSLPPFFAPCKLIRPSDNSEFYFYDGEIRDTLSTHVAFDNGADLIISSFSMQPYNWSAEVGSLHEYGLPVILNQALYQVLEQKVDSSKNHRIVIRNTYNKLEAQLRQSTLPEDQIERILETYRSETGYRPEVDNIYIAPRPQNHEMFFVDHFSLSTSVLEKIVKIGFKSALNALRGLDLSP